MKRLILSLISLCVFLSASATRIALLADVHVTPGNANDAKLRESIAEINGGDADVVVLAGDLTNEGSDVQLNNVKSILDALTKPLYVIPGNHELNWSQSAGKTFVDIWGSDRFVTQVDDLLIVGIACGPYMKMGDGHVKQEDLSWLDNTLRDRVKPGMKVISVNHYPLLPDLDNMNDYVRVLQKYPVAVHLCGHYHRFRYYEGVGIDGLINRALDMKNGDYGYTLIDVVNDSIKQWNKKLGEIPVLVNAFPIKKEIPQLTDVAPRINSLPEGVTVDLIHADGASIFTRLAIDADNIYFGTSLGEAKAISKHDGSDPWHGLAPRIGSQFSRPALSADGNVYFPTISGGIKVLAANSGAIVGALDTHGLYVADGLVVDDILYQGGYKTFKAWNLKTNQLLWSFDDIDNYCQAAPVVSGNDVIFGAWDTWLRCLDRKTGKLKWKWNNGKSANMLGPGNCVPVVTKDKVIIVAPDRYMTAINRKNGKTIWRVNDYKVRESLGVSADGKVAYAKTMDGEIVAVSTQGKKYKLLWVVDAKMGYEHTPCVVVESKGVVYAGSRTGVVVAIDPVSQKVLWHYKMGNSALNGFEIDDNGDVYASLIEGKIYRISTK